MSEIDPFIHCPVFNTENFILRRTSLEDAGDLLLCYSDKAAVPYFNSDNCETDFYFQTLDEMQGYINVWDREYSERVYVRFTVIDRKTKRAVGTMEFCPWSKSVEGYGKLAVLRIDLASGYETEPVITEILQLVSDYLCDLFDVENIFTKAVPEDKERIEALIHNGFTKLENNLIVPFRHYYIL
jgi:RimJ/RimL family protein N-acetyltransferase